jgi:hypothetical protein
MKTTHTIAAVLLTLAGLTAPVLAQGTTPTAPATIDNTDVKAKPTPAACNSVYTREGLCC